MSKAIHGALSLLVSVALVPRPDEIQDELEKGRRAADRGCTGLALLTLLSCAGAAAWCRIFGPSERAMPLLVVASMSALPLGLAAFQRLPR